MLIFTTVLLSYNFYTAKFKKKLKKNIFEELNKVVSANWKKA